MSKQACVHVCSQMPHSANSPRLSADNGMNKGGPSMQGSITQPREGMEARPPLLCGGALEHDAG